MAKSRKLLSNSSLSTSSRADPIPWKKLATTCLTLDLNETLFSSSSSAFDSS